MKLKMVCALIIILSTDSLWAFASSSPVCDVVADFSNITAMQSRNRVESPGPFSMTSSSKTYNTTDHVEITLSGAVYTGLVVDVIDSNGLSVGSFNFDDEVGIGSCNPFRTSATHNSSHGNVSSRTFFWIPPPDFVGDVIVEAYVLSGERGVTSSQTFYRFVADDDSALIIQQDLLFSDRFESLSN